MPNFPVFPSNAFFPLTQQRVQSNNGESLPSYGEEIKKAADLYLSKQPTAQDAIQATQHLHQGTEVMLSLLAQQLADTRSELSDLQQRVDRMA
jgi:hypothetical protein